MLLFLAAGVLLGALSVVFLLQNLDIVTVSFLSWDITASLALILFAALICGMLIISLLLLPSLVRDGFRLSSLRSQKKNLEEALANEKATAKTTVVVTPPEETA